MAVCLLSHARSLVCCSLSLSLSYVALSLLLAQKYLVFQNHSSNTDAYTSLTVAMDYLADDSVLAHIYVACRSALLLLPLSAHVAHMSLNPKQALLFIFYFTPDVLE